MRFLKPATLILFCLLLTQGAKGQSQDLKAISKAYIDAYFAMDQDTYAKYLSEDAVWSDPTWSEVSPQNRPAVGKANFLAHLKQATAGITNLKFDIDEHFVSGPVAVFEGTMSYSYTDTRAGKTYDFKVREVTVLEFKDGKIIKHTDYGDFKAWLKQYSSQ